MAAHLHDSVLQTLALVQRADDPSRMAALARRQERELRGWLYGGGSEPNQATVRAAVEHLAGVIEDRHGVVMDVVAVGDAPLDPAMESLVAAAGEAMTNAARWSGCPTVSVYVEATPQGVDVFVRDRGAGFDPQAVDGDSRGIATRSGAGSIGWAGAARSPARRVTARRCASIWPGAETSRESGCLLSVAYPLGL